MLAALLWNLVSPRKLDSLQVVSIVAGLNAIFSVDSAYLTKDALGSMPNLNAMVPPLSVLLDTVIAAGLLSN